jgi:hypothetical protein
MILVIKPRTGEIFEFFMRDEGGEIWLSDVSEKKKSLSREKGFKFSSGRLCEGGIFHGVKVRATPATFEATCRRWYRVYRRRS